MTLKSNMLTLGLAGSLSLISGATFAQGRPLVFKGVAGASGEFKQVSQIVSVTATCVTTALGNGNTTTLTLWEQGSTIIEPQTVPMDHITVETTLSGRGYRHLRLACGNHRADAKSATIIVKKKSALPTQ